MLCLRPTRFCIELASVFEFVGTTNLPFERAQSNAIDSIQSRAPAFACDSPFEAASFISAAIVGHEA